MFDALDFLYTPGQFRVRGTALIIGPRGDGKKWTTSPNAPRTAGEPSTS